MSDEQFQTLVLDQFHSLRDEVKDIKIEVRELRKDVRFLQDWGFDHAKRLEEIYQSRNTVKIKFGWEWGAVSLAIAFLASGLASGMTKLVWK